MGRSDAPLNTLEYFNSNSSAALPIYLKKNFAGD